MEVFETRTTCRSCGAGSLPIVLDLGRVPVADRLLREDQLADPEPLLPLTVVFCEACGLLQPRDTVAPALFFGEASRV